VSSIWNYITTYSAASQWNVCHVPYSRDHHSVNENDKKKKTFAVSCRNTGIEVRHFYRNNIPFLLYNFRFYPCLKFYDSKRVRKWITNSVGHSPFWEANSSSVKKSPSFYVPRRFITAFTRSRPLSWARSIQSMPPSHFLNIRFNIILPFMPRSSKWYLSVRSPHQNPASTSPVSLTCHMLHKSPSSWFDYPKNILWEVQRVID